MGNAPKRSCGAVTGQVRSRQRRGGWASGLGAAQSSAQLGRRADDLLGERTCNGGWGAVQRPPVRCRQRSGRQAANCPCRVSDGSGAQVGALAYRRWCVDRGPVLRKVSNFLDSRSLRVQRRGAGKYAAVHAMGSAASALNLRASTYHPAEFGCTLQLSGSRQGTWLGKGALERRQGGFATEPRGRRGAGMGLGWPCKVGRLWVTGSGFCAEAS